MWSKLHIRRLINETKIKYNETRDKDLMISIYILKGLYLAIGGEKGIPMPLKYDKITLYSKIIFKYKLKLDNIEKAYCEFYDSMRELGKVPEYFIKYKMPDCNADLANLLADIVTAEYDNDIIVNYNTIYNITMKILKETE